jgi:hypothetical protein
MTQAAGAPVATALRCFSFRSARESIVVSAELQPTLFFHAAATSERENTGTETVATGFRPS